MRGDIHRVPSRRGASSHQQRGSRFGVIVQSDDLMLSTVIIAPTSTSASPSVFRPEIEIDGQKTRVLTEQVVAWNAEQLGPFAGRLDRLEMEAVDDALRLALGLDCPILTAGQSCAAGGG